VDQVLAEMKAEYLAEASAAFDRMMREDPEQMLTFSQIERRAVEVSRELGAKFVQRRLKLKEDAERVNCPRCGRAASACAGEAEVRSLQSLTGPVEFERRKYRCARCRIRFFPHGRRAGPGR